MPTEKSIYDLDILEYVIIEDSLLIRRVPGGWVFTEIGGEIISSVFVPYINSSPLLNMEPRST